MKFVQKGQSGAEKKVEENFKNQALEETKIDIEGLAERIAKKVSTLDSKTYEFQIVSTPSMFKPYPEKSRIFAKTYSYWDVSRLSEIRLPLDKQYEIMMEGIIAEGFKVEEITLFDFIYIGVMRKLQSMGDIEFSISYTCLKCKKENDKIFGFRDIGFDGFEDNIKKFPIEVEFFDIGKLHFSPLTVGKFIWLLKNDYFYLKDSSGNYIEDSDGLNIRDAVAFMAGQCVDKSFETIYEMFKEVRNEKDKEILNKVDELLNHGMLPLSFRCSTIIGDKHDKNKDLCGKAIEVDLLGGESMIMPFRGETETIESRINLG